MTNLAIIIVSWNVRDLLTNCLRTIEDDLNKSQLSGQIWVVDNASTDDSPAMVRRDFPQVQLIEAKENLGFAGGNNAALRALGFSEQPESLKRNGFTKPLPADSGQSNHNLPEAVLLLNPDTLLHPGALKELYNFLQLIPQAGIAGARLQYGDGTFQHGAFAFPGLWQLAIELLPLPGRLAESRFNGRYSRSLFDSDEPFEIDHPLGAAMCVRREAIEQVGLLDETYHMYVEEIDWSRRIVSAGWQAYCVPAACITHFGGQSTGQIKVSSFINLWRSRYRFYRKYYGPLKLWLAGQIVQMGMQQRGRRDIQAVTQGTLTTAEKTERQSGYRQVINIWQGREQ